MTKRAWGFTVLLGGLFALAELLSFFFPAEENVRVAPNSGFREVSAQFELLAREKGAKYAFDALLRAAMPPNIDIHLLGHEIGNILYEQEGVEGIARCTQDFRNACSHAIVIGALNEFGTEALPMIRKACRKAPGGSGAYTMCFHGLGHGVFAYYGYSFPETVEFCRSTGTVAYGYQEFSQCVGGAVMELMGGGGHDRDAWLLMREKYLDVARPLRPCDTALVPEEAKSLCLVYLTPRLFELAGADLGKPDPATFPEAFSFCEALPQSATRLRDACFGGFGKEFIVLAGEHDIRDVAKYSDDTFKKALSWCGLAPSQDARGACVGDAVASLFWGGENDPDAAFRFCSLASAEVSLACYSRLASDISEYIFDKDTREALCARTPVQSRSACEIYI